MKAPLAELIDIIGFMRERGVRSITDFGCGLGRNVPQLLKAFDRVLLVEDRHNTELLRSRFDGVSPKKLQIQGWDEFVTSNTRYDASLICCVLHTIPRAALRRAILEENIRHLSRDGWIALVVPRNDPKYRGEFIAGMPEYDSGVIHFFSADKTFSFYRNFTIREVEKLMSDLGCADTHRIPSPRRTIFLGQPNGD